MRVKKSLLIVPAIALLSAAGLGWYFLSAGSAPPTYTLAGAVRREIRVVVDTNGIIEPAERAEIYAPVDGFVISIQDREGAEVRQGRVIMHLRSDQLRTALAEANASLLAEKRQARIVETGPSREEVSGLDALIAEASMQLAQQNSELAAEESLYAKKATSRVAVENLRKQRDLLELRAEGLKQKKQDLLGRYSTEEKEWEQRRIQELATQVSSLEQQLRAESVAAPRNGVIYSLHVKQGSYVNRGELLAHIYEPGHVALRTYVDEPDLGRIRAGQPVRIEWNGLPNQYWTGVVEKPAQQVVAMSNRSVGDVLCSISSNPEGLIPNLNVRVEITTDLKKDALVVPKNAVFNHDAKPSVLLPAKAGNEIRAVTLGLVTPEQIEIVSGIREGDSVILNPMEVINRQ